MTDKPSDTSNDHENWIRLNQLRNVNLAKLLKVVMSMVVVVGGTIALIGLATQPTLAASVSVPDVSITTNDGTLSEVTINPNLTITWSGLDGDVNRMKAVLYVANSSGAVGASSYYTDSLNCAVESHSDCNSPSGSVNLEYGSSAKNIFDHTGYNNLDNTTRPTPDEFEVADGNTNSTTVYLMVRMIAFDSDSNIILQEDKPLSFTVTHTNEAANTSVEGSIDTGASG